MIKKSCRGKAIHQEETRTKMGLGKLPRDGRKGEAATSVLSVAVITPELSGT